jgi:hypothetical protein
VRKWIGATVLTAAIIVLLALWWLQAHPVADTEESLYPDLRDRTAVRMRTVTVFVERYYDRTGRVPSEFRDLGLVLKSGASVDSLGVDAWATGLRMERTDSTVTLVSAGPDRAFGNSDDIRLVWKRPLPREQSHRL